MDAMSAPAANAFSLPVMTIAPTLSFASWACSPAPSSCMSWGLRAFNCLGRLSVTRPTRPFCSTLISSKLTGGNHLRVETVEGSEERSVHLARGNRLAVVALHAGRARTSDERHPVAEIRRLPHARIDAHVRHHAGDDELLGVRGLERCVELGAPKAVRIILLDHALAFARPHALVA